MRHDERPAGALDAGAPARPGAPSWLAWLGLVGLVVFYLAGLGLRPLLLPDEYRYAEAAREMVASGDWIVPHLDGVVYLEKPILGYWATALSLLLLGERAVAARLPSALATLCSAAIVFALVRRFGPGRGWAYAAAALFLTSVGVASLATVAVFDPLFSAGVTATLAAFFVAAEKAPGAARQGWLAASGVACGVAFLTKGFLAFAIPVCVVLPYLLWSRRARDLLRLGWTPLAAALVTATPWSLAIALRVPDFWTQFVVDEHLRRFFGGSEAQHAEPAWIFLPVLVIGALPWTPLWIPAWRAARHDSALARFCACWTLGPLVLLSASSGKLPTYVLPCFAPLCAWLALAAAQRPAAHWALPLRRLAGTLALLLGLGGLALLSPLPAALGLERELGPEWAQLRLPWAGVLLLASGFAIAGSRSASAAVSFGSIAITLLVAYTGAFVWFPTGNEEKTPRAWLEPRLAKIPGDAIAVADHRFVYAACWHLRRDDVRIFGEPGELAPGLLREAGGASERLLDERDLESLLRDPARRRPVVLLARTRRLPKPLAPSPRWSDSGRSVTLAVFDPTPGAAAAPPTSTPDTAP